MSVSPLEFLSAYADIAIGCIFNRMTRLLLFSFSLVLLLAASPDAAAVPVQAPAVTFGIDEDLEAQDPTFRLSTPRPNPFGASTNLDLVVEGPGRFSVTVHDALGRRVAVLVNDFLEPGTYRLTVEGRDLPTGLYVIRAVDGEGAAVTRSAALVR